MSEIHALFTYFNAYVLGGLLPAFQCVKFCNLWISNLIYFITIVFGFALFPLLMVSHRKSSISLLFFLLPSPSDHLLFFYLLPFLLGSEINTYADLKA